MESNREFEKVQNASIQDVQILIKGRYDVRLAVPEKSGFLFTLCTDSYTSFKLFCCRDIFIGAVPEISASIQRANFFVPIRDA